MLQLRQRSCETVLNRGHAAVSMDQLFLQSCDITELRHLPQDGAKVLQRLPDLTRIVQHHLHPESGFRTS